MNQKEKQDLLKLDKFNRWMVVTYWRLLLVKQKYLRQSLPLRLVPIHAVGMLIVLLFFPHNSPNIVTIPIIGCAAYYVAILLLYIKPSSYKSAIRKVRAEND